MKTFFTKLEYHFLVEGIKIEKALFLYKTAASETNVKTNRMVSTKWAFFFLLLYFFENFVSVYEPLMKSRFYIPMTKMPYSYFL